MLASDVTDSYGLYFRYDQNGSPIGFAYQVGDTSTEYYYTKNLQGDITGIIREDGERVATYQYDAWGDPINPPTSGVGYLNPLRYRGYVYDTETKLYYLQSRYYSPEIGRFISADSYAVTYSSAIGANLFAYCGNNPVMCEDSDGDYWETAFDIASLTVTISETIEDPEDPLNYLALAGDIIDCLMPVGGIGEAIKGIDAVSDAAKTISTNLIRNLVEHDNGKTFQVIYNTLVELGYYVCYRVINARLTDGTIFAFMIFKIVKGLGISQNWISVRN